MTPYDVPDRGSVTVEVAIWSTIIVIVGSLLWAFGRAQLAGSAVTYVAINAAREASHARTASQAQREATSTAAQTIAEQGLRCTSFTITVDTSGFTVPVGQPAQVRVDVTCVVDVADLAVPGLLGSKALRQSWSSALDTFRGRT
ncbi:TadE/TadG family type IV pilus assembly protein [Actinocrispum wychmicini]|uniref:TadE-like protein n=1 Tax=Actinocrispum wychmicini TaxID=1213861 RepID=A0A4R2IYX5_9PSEU|nr:pilus assembly protein TadE [Actinocrispum wychmicini]TCO49646.1 hypothetical protein EV192_11411 [Actinocrispum wychmicini]